MRTGNTDAGSLHDATTRENPDELRRARGQPRVAIPEWAHDRPLERRELLRMAGAAVGALVVSPVPASVLTRVASLQSPRPIGLQLYTLRSMMQRNVEWTLREVAAIGYREVEFAGLFDTAARTVRVKYLDKVGLSSPSSHIPIQRLRTDLPGVVDEAQALGNTYVVCPWIDEKDRRDADGWKRVAAEFNRIGESLRRVGLQFAYHNHDFEFQRLPGGEVGFDILLAETDPKLVRIELDLFWITKGGRDPLAYFAQYPGRFPLVHVKDMAGTGTMVNVGRGHIDWPRIFAKRREAGIEHFLVEHDNPRNPLSDVKESFQYMARLGL